MLQKHTQLYTGRDVHITDLATRFSCPPRRKSDTTSCNFSGLSGLSFVDIYITSRITPRIVPSIETGWKLNHTPK